MTLGVDIKPEELHKKGKRAFLLYYTMRVKFNNDNVLNASYDPTYIFFVLRNPNTLLKLNFEMQAAPEEEFASLCSNFAFSFSLEPLFAHTLGPWKVIIYASFFVTCSPFALSPFSHMPISLPIFAP